MRRTWTGGCERTTGSISTIPDANAASFPHWDLGWAPSRRVVSSVAFFGSFAAVRGVTHAIRRGVGPFRNLAVGGRHLHHLVIGITALLLTGYTWLLIADDAPRDRRSHRANAIAYGMGAALTLDEFALWLDLEDVYWARQGRISVDALMLFGAILSASVWGGPFVRAAASEILHK